jgi:integrase
VGASDDQRAAHLTQVQRQALLAECGTDLGNYIRALLYTAARPNEMQDAKRRDFDAKQGTIRFATYKGDGTKRERTVPLSKLAIEFFKEMGKDKLPEAPLTTFEGQRWDRQVWATDLRAAVVAANAKLDRDAKLPSDTVAYTMRHCAITDMLSAGINVTAVAKMAGTSIVMIEKNYFKFIATDVNEKLGQITAF